MRHKHRYLECCLETILTFLIKVWYWISGKYKNINIAEKTRTRHLIYETGPGQTRSRLWEQGLTHQITQSNGKLAPCWKEKGTLLPDLQSYTCQCLHVFDRLILIASYIHRNCSLQKHDWRRVVPLIQYKVESGWDEAANVLPSTNHVAINKIELSLVLQVLLWWPFLFATFPTLPPRWCRSTWLCGPTQSFQSTRSWNHTSPFHCGISMVLWTHCCSVFPPTHFAGHAGELWASSGLAYGNMGAHLGCGRDTAVKKEQVHQVNEWW